MTKVKGLFLFSLCVLTGLSAGGSSAGPTAEEIVRKTRQKYESLRYLTLRFQQIFEWKLTGEKQEIMGVVHVAPGDKYRVETPTQLIVSDGKTVWTYNKPVDQVIIDKLGEDRAPLLRDLVLRYMRDYRAELLGEEELAGRKCWVLLLKAKTPGELVGEIKVWVDAERYIVWQTEEEDANGNRNRYVVTAFEEPPSLSAGLFTFSPPDSAEVIDLRLQ